MSDWQSIYDTAAPRDLAKGDTLFRRDDPVKSMFLVRSGEIALERSMADGTALTLHIATDGMAVAEASLFADTYHCDAVARYPTTIATLPRNVAMNAFRASSDAALGLMSVLARDVQTQRARIEILRLRRVADRLDAWLDLYGPPKESGWVRVADAIGVSQPALYRELARRRSSS
jgi:CRP-like cAMP-binding protein